MTPEQCRAARELLGWDEWRLASKATCSRETVKRFEAARGPSFRSTVRALKVALSAAGVEFPANDQSDFIVRLVSARS